jgi:hypothetical protein
MASLIASELPRSYLSTMRRSAIFRRLLSAQKTAFLGFDGVE